MLALLKRWWSAATPKPGLHGVEQWARAKGTGWRRVRDDEGFVVDGAHRGVAWRLEWGPSHRPYIVGTELRCIAELGLHRDLQVMVLNRLLMEASEAKVYDEYIEGVQTLVAQAYGAGRYRRTSQFAWTGLWASALTVPAFGLTIAFGPAMIRAFGLDPEVEDLAIAFWIPRMIGGPLAAALWGAVAYFNGVGRTRLPLALSDEQPSRHPLS